MVRLRNSGRCCLAALAVLACACAGQAGAATAPLGTLPRPALALRRAGSASDNGGRYSPLRLKGGGRLNLGATEKTDEQMAEAEALKVREREREREEGREGGRERERD